MWPREADTGPLRTAVRLHLPHRWDHGCSHCSPSCLARGTVPAFAMAPGPLRREPLLLHRLRSACGRLAVPIDSVSSSSPSAKSSLMAAPRRFRFTMALANSVSTPPSWSGQRLLQCYNLPCLCCLSRISARFCTWWRRRACG